MSRGVLIGSNPGGGGGGAPSGAAGGELAGTYPNPTVKDGVIDDANIVVGGLTNAAISASAAIAASKLAAIPESGVTNLVSDLAAKAPTASPTFTGTVTLPSGLVLPANVSIPTSAVAVTQAANDNSTKVATTAYADAIAALKANLAGSPNDTTTPSFNGLCGVAFSLDTVVGGGGGAISTGVKYVMRIPIRVAAASGTRTIKTVVVTAQSGGTTGLIAVYNSSGTQLGSTSADQIATWGTTGERSATVGTFALAVGDIIYVEVLFVGTTGPAFAGGNATSAQGLNTNLTGANLRAASNGTGASTVDASITPGSLANTGVAKAIWCGIL